jgi:putative oxidoreductase
VGLPTWKNPILVMHAHTSFPTDPAASRPTKSGARRLPTVVRFLLGVPLVVFGLNGFLNFIPPPPTPLPEEAMAFATALVNSGYMMPLIALTLLTVGVLLVVNRFVPLALALFAPFIVNSVAFHVFLERSGLPMAAVFLGLELYLAWVYRHAFRPMLSARVAPQ